VTLANFEQGCTFPEVKDIDPQAIALMATLLRSWQTTAHYEDIVLQELTSASDIPLRVAPLRRALVDLFTFMLRALSDVHITVQRKLGAGSNSNLVFPLLPYEEYAAPLKVLENEAHAHASRFLQRKQYAMLQRMQQEQLVLAKKLEELGAARVPVLEKKVTEDFREAWGTMSGGVGTPSTVSLKQDVE
jgi:hypothetical protein